MKAFLASLLVLMVVSVVAYVALDRMGMSSSEVFSSDSVRLN
jgi:type II secretory pathway pseudopilin PulG